GVSVVRVEEALKAIEFPGVQSVQIIFNMFRQRPADVFFARARERKVGILARLPLSSGMLTGKLTAASSFASDDHRSFNREGAARGGAYASPSASPSVAAHVARQPGATACRPL